MDCARASLLIERAFVHRDPKALGRIQEHLDGCRACQQRYDRLFAAGLALEGSPDEPPKLLSTPERELLRAAVLPELEGPRGRGWWTRPLPLTAAALAAGLLVAAAALLSPQNAPDGEGLGVRGADRSAADRTAVADLPVGIRPLCLAPSDRGFRARSMVSRPRCRRADTLGFSYRNATDRTWNLQLVMVGPGGQALEVCPTAPLPPTSDEEPLETTVPLADTRPGRSSILALFSREPLPPGTLRDAVSRRALQALERPDAAHVVRMTIEIGE